MAADHYSGLQLRVSNVADNAILQTLLAGTLGQGKTGEREDGKWITNLIHAATIRPFSSKCKIFSGLIVFVRKYFILTKVLYCQKEQS